MGDLVTYKHNYGIRESQLSLGQWNRPKKKKKNKRNLRARSYKTKLEAYGMYDCLIAQEVLTPDNHKVF